MRGVLIKEVKKLDVNEQSKPKKKRVKKIRTQKQIVDKIRKLLKELEIEEDYFLTNTIEKYGKIVEYMDSMEVEIDTIGLMYDYTNKAKETNKTKNPLISEYRAYFREFTNSTKILLDVIKAYSKSDIEDDKIQEYLDEFNE